MGLQWWGRTLCHVDHVVLGGKLEEPSRLRWEDLEGAGEPQLEQTDGGPGSGMVSGLDLGSWGQSDPVQRNPEACSRE